MITYQEQAPGLAQTASETAAALLNATSLAASQQADAARFIAENGRQVLDGHPDVGIPAGSQTWSAGHAPYSEAPS